MTMWRSFMSVVLVLITTVLVSCSGPSTPPPTYTSEKLVTIQQALVPIVAAKEQGMAKLGELIDDQNWVDTQTFIHGPLGLLRQQMSYLSSNLLEQDEKKARTIAKELFVDFEKLDAAAKVKNYNLAIGEYSQAIKDFDAFLAIPPKS